MANVQPNSFTKIANELLEVMPLFKFNATQLRIILVVWRYTYGFKRKEHNISISFLVNATGISKRQVQKEVGNLIELQVLRELQKASFNQPRIIGFNKNYDEWQIQRSGTNEQQVNNHSEMNDNTPPQVNNSSPLQMNDSAPLQVNNSSPKKESIKEIYKENIKESSSNSSTSNPHTFYEQNFGVLSPFVTQSITDWCNDLSDELVIESMKIALKAGKDFDYAEGALKKWAKKNVKTLDQLKALEVQFQRQKENKGTYYQSKPKEIVPDWFKERKKQSNNLPNPEPEASREDVAAMLEEYKRSAGGS
ncbi:replication protein [Ornithinibacillus sp. JPR2-1]|uniref:replication protein n=1 Tax=Ornithinibacillus sp. JPR2-1 TaxID=2094019 RepID=UPI0031CFFF05